MNNFYKVMAVPSFKTGLFLIGLVAIISRIIVASSIWSLPESYVLNADSGEYHQNALILAGLIKGNFEPVFGQSPFTVILGTILHFLFGRSVLAVIVLQILLGTGTAVLTALITRRLSQGTLEALIAGLFVALSRPLIVYDSVILATSSAVFLSVLVIWLSLFVADKATIRLVAIFGLVLGISAICRPNSLLFVPLALYFTIKGSSAFTRSKKILPPLVLILTTLVPIAPVTISNAVRGGVFVPITWSSGPNLFIGNNQSSPGRFKPIFGSVSAKKSFEVFTQKAEAYTGKKMNQAEVSRFWTAMTWREIADDPAHFGALLIKKTVYMFNEFEIPNNINIPFLNVVLPVMRFPFLGFTVFLSLGIVGLCVLWKKTPPGGRAVHATVAIAILTMLTYHVMSRFRAPALPALAIGAGIGIVWIKDTILKLKNNAKQSPNRRSAVLLAAASLGICTLSIIAQLPILNADLKPEVNRLSHSYATEHQFTAAITTLNRVLKHAVQQKNVNLITATKKEIKFHTKNQSYDNEHY